MKRKVLPTAPGKYYWTEWACYVQVYSKRGGRHLYVCIPGGVEVRVTARIAGSFIALQEPNDGKES